MTKQTIHTKPYVHEGAIDANVLEALAKQRPGEILLNSQGILTLLGGIRQLEAEIRKLKAALQAKPLPDIYWDDDDPETSESSINDVVVLRYEQHGLSVGDIVTIQQAVQLGNTAVRITSVPDRHGDGDLGWEVVGENNPNSPLSLFGTAESQQPAGDASVEMVLTQAARDVLAELNRATAKFPTWPSDPIHALAVLGQEFGELTKDVLQLTYEPHKTSAQNVRTEAIQTAAMAVRFVMGLNRYVYQPGAQHSQTPSSSSIVATTDIAIARQVGKDGSA